MALCPQEIKRLALIRFIYLQGLEHAGRPHPLSSQTLLSFHDAVEMFLLLAAEHLNVSLTRGVTFEGYFAEIQSASGVQLPSRPAMRRMNSSRVNLKHHGSIPSTSDLDQFRADVTTFLTDATQLVFQADFSDADMIDLVTQRTAVEKLRDAATHVGQGDYTEALALLSEAFDGLLKDYADRKVTAEGASPYTWWRTEGAILMPLRGRREHDPELVKRTDLMLDALTSMQQAMRVVAMGLDYRRYARFEMLVPQIVWYMTGAREVRPIPGLVVGEDDYQWCRQFVIETALHLAEIDFDLDLPGVA